ncbi:MAG: hypothetical protein Ct9H300mP6_18620 [Gammaproteobacteria bacterium]|nr:MAG: hypothetical protein Ct9H300mP6_18620 [Gammaproteobacteria bacterium]
MLWQFPRVYPFPEPLPNASQCGSQAGSRKQKLKGMFFVPLLNKLHHEGARHSIIGLIITPSVRDASFRIFCNDNCICYIGWAFFPEPNMRQLLSYINIPLLYLILLQGKPFEASIRFGFSHFD